MITTLELTARDPVVSRDGRPFGAGQGNRMRSLNWPLPSMIAGSLRTALGKLAGKGDFSSETARELLQVAVAGVFPTVDGQLYLPAPQDCVVERPDADGRSSLVVHRVKPHLISQGRGGDWRNASLSPVMLPEPDMPPEVVEDFKPTDAPAWWPVDRFADWLMGKPLQFDHTFLHSPVQEDRTHVVLQPATGAADEGQLFTTTGLALGHLERQRQDASKKQSPPKKPSLGERFAEIKLAARVEAGGWCAEHVGGLNEHHPTGGERRLVHWRAVTDSTMWDCPDSIRKALQSTDKVRMALATPAIFHDGWKPGWLNHDLVGSPPGSDVQLELVGLTIQRWRAVSGWSLARINNQGQLDSQGRPGPKPIRRIVPAGGVYFFKVVAGTPAGLADRWLRSVSDHEQDQRDGFGLATWGTW